MTKRSLVLPGRGTLLVSTDLHGNLEDFLALEARAEAAWRAGVDLHWALLGDLVHGPDDRGRQQMPDLYDYDDEMLGDEDPDKTMCPWLPLDGPDGLGAEPSPNLRNFAGSFPEGHHEIGSMCVPAKVDSFQPLAQQVKAELLAACEA